MVFSEVFPPWTNSSPPENMPSQKETSLPTIHFQRVTSVLVAEKPSAILKKWTQNSYCDDFLLEMLCFLDSFAGRCSSMFFGYWIYSFKKRGYNQPNLASKYYGSKASPKKSPFKPRSKWSPTKTKPIWKEHSWLLILEGDCIQNAPIAFVVYYNWILNTEYNWYNYGIVSLNQRGVGTWGTCGESNWHPLLICSSLSTAKCFFHLPPNDIPGWLRFLPPFSFWTKRTRIFFTP